MFLVVFVTVVISIIGVFAQVLSLQSARMNNSQIGLMQTVVAWHYAATNAAYQFKVSGNAFLYPTGVPLQYANGPFVAPADATNSMNGCMLDSVQHNTKVTSPPAPIDQVRPVSCVNPLPATSALFSLTLATRLPPGTLASTPALPPGYQVNPYNFHSIFFKRGGLDYVVTYIPVPAVPTNYLSLPDSSSGAQIGYTIGDLQQQFARVANFSLSYGSVVAAVPPAILATDLTLHVQQKGGAAIDYPIPKSVPLGSFGIISLAQ